MASTKFASNLCGEGPLFNLTSMQIQMPYLPLMKGPEVKRHASMNIHIMGEYDLGVFNRTNKVAYTKNVCATWDSKHTNHNSSKVHQLKEHAIASDHKSKMIHGQ